MLRKDFEIGQTYEGEIEGEKIIFKILTKTLHRPFRYIYTAKILNPIDEKKNYLCFLEDDAFAVGVRHYQEQEEKRRRKHGLSNRKEHHDS